MSGQDAEIEWLKAGVSCAALLERLPPPWRLDRAQSTRQSLKYRRGTGEILIVNHDGRGWWDPLSDRKGDIFTLVQHLETRGVMPSGDIRVRRGDQDAGGIGRQTRQEPLERGDGRGTHAAGGRGIERVETALLNRRETERVDRGLAHRDAGQGTGAARQAEQRLATARGKVAIIGAAHLDAGQHASVVTVREPGTATSAIRATVSDIAPSVRRSGRRASASAGP